MGESLRKVTSESLGDGVIEALFQGELEKVLANIDDLGTDAKKKRRIILEFTITPTESRDMAGIAIATKTTLAPVKAVGVGIILSREAGKPVALEANSTQENLFPGMKEVTRG